MAAGAVYTRLYIEGNEYFMTLKKAQAQTQEWAKDTTKNVNTVGRDFANLARSVIGITAAFQTIKKTVSEGINFNKFVAEQTAAFGVMMKSTDAAKAKIQELYTFAVESPLTFKETVSASKQLLAYGFAADSLVKNMEMLGTVAKATGHSLDDISYVYGTLKTQGRAYSRDLMQFAMRGIPIYDELASVMGVTTQQIKKLTEQGAVGFEQVEKAFKNMTSEGGRFTGMMDAYMKTLSGQLSMLGDIAQQSAGKLASGITSAMTGGLGGIMDALGGSGGTLTNLGTDLGMIATAMLKIAEAAIRLAPVIVLIVKTLIAGKILQMLTKLPSLLLKSAMGMLNAAVGVEALNGAFVTLGSTTTGIFSQIGASVSMLGTQLMALVANPAFLAVAGLGVGLAATATAMARARAAEATLRDTNPKEALRQTVMGNMQGAFASDPTGTAASGIAYTASQVKAAAKEFNLSLGDTVKVLEGLGVVTKGVSTQLQNDITQEEDKLIKAAQKAMKSRWEIEAQWYASFAGGIKKDAKGVKSPRNVEDYTNRAGKYSEGLLAAKDYIATFEADRANMKAAFGEVFSDDDLKDGLTDELGKLKAKLLEGASIIQYEDEYDDTGKLIFKGSQFDDELRKRIKKIEDILEEGGKSAVKVVQRDMWYLRELQAKATGDEQDDLLLAKDKEMATLEDKYATGLYDLQWYLDGRAAIEQKYYADSNAALMETMKNGTKGFWSTLAGDSAANLKSGDMISGTAGLLAGGAEGTQAGAMFAGGDPYTQAIMALGDFVLSIENVQKVLDPFTTMFEGARAVMEPLINNVLSGVISVIMELGAAIGDTLAPFINYTGTQLQIFAGLIKIFIMPRLKILGALFAWFNDKVIVPVGNAIIDVFNGVIDMINGVILWVRDKLGTNTTLIERLDHLLTTTEAAMASQIKDDTDSLSATISYLAKKLNEMVDAQIDSAQDLYEVGAISGEAYSQLVKDANAMRFDHDLQLVSLADQQLTTMQEIYARLTELYALKDEAEGDVPTKQDEALLAAQASAAKVKEWWNSLFAGGTNSGASVPSPSGTSGRNDGDNIDHDPRERFDVGAVNLPYDTRAIVHKGESIIPKTFADGIRSGEMVLSGPGGSAGGSGDVYVSVTVEGSVQKESDLAASIAQNIYLQRKRGLLTV